jgi:hypothetical protein
VDFQHEYRVHPYCAELLVGLPTRWSSLPNFALKSKHVYRFSFNCHCQIETHSITERQFQSDKIARVQPQEQVLVWKLLHSNLFDTSYSTAILAETLRPFLCFHPSPGIRKEVICN